MFYASIKNIKKQNKNMFDVSCVTCSYRISEGSKTALSGDLQYIILTRNAWQSLANSPLGTAVSSPSK